MIPIKPHHFVDILTALGCGITDPEPHHYGHAVHSVTKALLADPDVLLRMELGADDICIPCCHNIDGLCDDTIDISFRPEAPKSKREWNLIIDKRWCARLGIAQDDTMTARELTERIKEGSADITDIYPEEPAEGTANRHENLQKGIEAFLSK